MKMPKSFIPCEKDLSKKTEELLKEPERSLEKNIQDIENVKKEGIEIEKSDYIIEEEQGQEWINKVESYIKNMDLPNGIKIHSHNWYYGMWLTNPPGVTISEERLVTVEKKNKYIPLFKITKQEKRRHPLIYVYYNKGIVCEDRNYEDTAIKLAKKLGQKSITTSY
ncbi:MAG: hypothetical protein KKA79_09090 [Nanoarchaeota archaeon]|nr:hypothetical protein [Nanoarchaeota archaeon]